MFTSAVEHCPLDDACKDNLVSCWILRFICHFFKAIFYGNRAACYAALEEYNLVISDCTSAVAFNPCYVKVLYRRSQAYEALQNYEDAIKGKLSSSAYFIQIALQLLSIVLSTNCNSSDLKAILELDPSYPKVKDHV